MVIKKNFKIINEDKTENSNWQAKISFDEKEKVKETMTQFFSSIKTLLREGAVLIEEGEISKKDEVEEFIESPTLQKKENTVYNIALGALPKEKSSFFASQIKGIKMSENYDFTFETEEKTELQEVLEEVISSELKSYANSLPAIMQERQEKLKLLTNFMPEVKKYLENTKK